MSKLPISAVIIVKNEEKKIRSCLSSLRDNVDEIIIVDDESVDATCQIAQKEFGAKVYNRALNGDFAAQRNFGAAQARNDWILALDADETVPGATFNKVAQVINSDDADRIELKRLNHLIDIPLYNPGASIWEKSKLYRKSVTGFSGFIHEELLEKGKLVRADACIHHFPLPSLGAMFEKMHRYTDIEAEHYVESGIVTLREIKYNLTVKPLKIFWKLYFKKKGYKDGTAGLVMSIMNTLGPVVYWLKIWERNYFKIKDEKQSG